MKKTLICFISGVLMAQSGAMAAVTIKKAASVSKKETTVQELGLYMSGAKRNVKEGN